MYATSRTSVLLAAHFETRHDVRSSSVYYLATAPYAQDAARQEVFWALGADVEPFCLSQHTYERSSTCTLLGLIPPRAYTRWRYPRGISHSYHTLFICSICDIHYSKAIWGDPDVFRPARQSH
ncbi:hypothetical protein F4604DRAFT_1112014 [Suillus subluteus]|nr:hypothetical protein F4604DRAFT_1112014 [Suillus subluteus]